MNAPGEVSGGLVLGVVITRLVLAVIDCGASPEDGIALWIEGLPKEFCRF